jgi:hypothetical protein
LSVGSVIEVLGTRVHQVLDRYRVALVIEGGHHRHGEVADAVNGALVVEHDGRISGYSTGLAIFGHTVAKPTKISRPASARHPSSPAPGSSCRSPTASWSAGA